MLSDSAASLTDLIPTVWFHFFVLEQDPQFTFRQCEVLYKTKDSTCIKFCGEIKESEVIGLFRDQPYKLLAVGNLLVGALKSRVGVCGKSYHHDFLKLECAFI